LLRFVPHVARCDSLEGEGRPAANVGCYWRFPCSTVKEKLSTARKPPNGSSRRIPWLSRFIFCETRACRMGRPGRLILVHGVLVRDLLGGRAIGAGGAERALPLGSYRCGGCGVRLSRCMGSLPQNTMAVGSRLGVAGECCGRWGVCRLVGGKAGGWGAAAAIEVRILPQMHADAR
jgi:hypothetical protein